MSKLKSVEKLRLLNENKKIRKTAALEKKLFKVIKRESPSCYREGFVKDALASLYLRLKF